MVQGRLRVSAQVGPLRFVVGHATLTRRFSLVIF